MPEFPGMEASASGNAESRIIEIESWFTPGRFAALLAVLIILPFWEVIFGSRTFVFHDFGLFGYPLAQYHRDSFWRGEIPLWNPLNNCGVPFLAQWNTLVLYPGSLIYLLFPLSWSLAVFNLAHLFLAGLGMFFLASAFSENRLAGALAGLAFAFNGFSLNCLMWPNNMGALGLMPWVVLFLWRGALEGRRSALKGALLCGLQLLTGAPELIALTWAAAIALALGESLNGRISPFHFLSRFVVMLGFGVAIAAAQLLPFVDLLLHSQRDTGFGGTSWSMPGWGIANFLVPLFNTYALEQGVHFQYEQFWTSSYYLPLIILVPAACSFGFARDKRIGVLWTVAILSLVVAMGSSGGVYPLIKLVLPAVGFLRYPVKFITLFVFLIPLLGAFTIAQWLKREGTIPVKPILRAATVITPLIAIILWFAKTYPQYAPPYSDWEGTLRSGLGRIIVMGIFIGAAFLLARAHTIQKQAIACGLLLLGVWGDALTHAPWQNPTVIRGVYEPGLAAMEPTPRFGEHRAMMSPEALYNLWAKASSDTYTNYLCNRLGLNCNVNLIDSVPKLDGFFSLNIRETEQIRALLYGKNWKPAPGIRDFLGVSQVTAPGKNFDWQLRPSALPLITAGQQLALTDDLTAVRGMIETNWNASERIFLPATASGLLASTNKTSAHITNITARAQEISFRITTPAPTVAVIAQSFYPHWKASVDGTETKLLRANYAFQAVPIPAGSHEIRIVYADQMFRIGLIISGTALIVIALLWRRTPHSA